jgi:VWFA-related protein
MSWHRLILSGGFLIALGWLGLVPVRTPGATGGQRKQSAETAPTSKVIKAEANLVLVDVAVTDKKNHYLKDLEQKDFHVFEDGVEQNIVSFSRAADMKAITPERKRYMVLFFDNMMVRSTAQMEVRQAAAKFVEMTASPDRMMAVMDFGGVLHVAQNFTANGELLNSAIKSVELSVVQTNAAGRQWTRGSQVQTDYATLALLRAFRDIAKMLSTVPGRKTVLFFSSGFLISRERQADFQDTLDALNKANVAVYAVGTEALSASGGVGQMGGDAGSAEATRAPSRRTWMGTSTGVNEQLLRTFASNTGGFPIVDTNDILGGMERVCQEMDESYVLGYVPLNPAHEGRYHKIGVKVDRPGAEVRAREGYVDMKSPDLLAGKPEGKVLEARAAGPEPGDIPVSLSAPYFYLQPGVALVNLALSVPGSSLEFEKQKGGFHSRVNILGIAYRDDGSVAARFSDAVNVDYDKQEKQALDKKPFEYQKCFKIAPGTYVLKVVLSAGGEKFGKYVLPLEVDPFSGKEFRLGGPALGQGIAMVTPQAEDMDVALLENAKPLIANGTQLVPAASHRFSKSMQPDIYVEVYNPLLATGKVQVGIRVDIVERKSNSTIYSTGMTPINQYAHAGSSLVPLIFKLPMDKFPSGDYRMEVRGGDSQGNVPPVRSTDFSLD